MHIRIQPEYESHKLTLFIHETKQASLSFEEKLFPPFFPTLLKVKVMWALFHHWNIVGWAA